MQILHLIQAQGWCDKNHRQQPDIATDFKAIETRLRALSCFDRSKMPTNPAGATMSMDATMMGNERLEILSCKIPRLSRRIATRHRQNLADYPLARASEWSPLPAMPTPLGQEVEEAEDLLE